MTLRWSVDANSSFKRDTVNYLSPEDGDIRSVCTSPKV